MRQPWHFTGLLQAVSHLGSTPRAPVSRPPRRSLHPLAGLSDAVTRFLAGLAHGRCRRVAIRQLARLSEAQLNDIGIERSRIPDVVTGLCNRQPAEPALTGTRRRGGYAPNPR